MTQRRRLGVVWLVTAACGCGGETTGQGGAGGTPSGNATGGILPVSGTGGSAPRDAGADVYAPLPDPPVLTDDPPRPPPACRGTTASIEPVSAAMPCTYAVPVPDGTVFDPTLVNVVYTAGDQNRYLIMVNSSAICDQGWRFINDLTQIEICGTPCDTIRNDPEGELVLVFGCHGPPPV
jgi:hypothetical protein